MSERQDAQAERAEALAAPGDATPDAKGLLEAVLEAGLGPDIVAVVTDDAIIVQITIPKEDVLVAKQPEAPDAEAQPE